MKEATEEIARRLAKALERRRIEQLVKRMLEVGSWNGA